MFYVTLPDYVDWMEYRWQKWIIWSFFLFGVHTHSHVTVGFYGTKWVRFILSHVLLFILFLTCTVITNEGFFLCLYPTGFFLKYLFSVVLISFFSSGPPCLSPPNNTCQKMMNDCVIPGQGELTATFRAACHHKERAIPGLRSPCHCTSIWVKEGKERCRLLVLCCLTDWK